MTDWIANGESGASVRAKLNGLIIVPSTVIAAPATSIIVPLSGGFPAYRFRFSNWIGQKDADHSAGVALAYEVSVDGGSTFIGTGSATFDEYQILDQTQKDTTASTILAEGYQDLGVDLGAWTPTTDPSPNGFKTGCGGYVDIIFPGDGTFAFDSEHMCLSRHNGAKNYLRGTGTINNSATSFDSSWNDRITHLCVQFYATEWNDSKILQGNYSLYGLV